MLSSVPSPVPDTWLQALGYRHLATSTWPQALKLMLEASHSLSSTAGNHGFHQQARSPGTTRRSHNGRRLAIGAAICSDAGLLRRDLPRSVLSTFRQGLSAARCALSCVVRIWSDQAWACRRDRVSAPGQSELPSRRIRWANALADHARDLSRGVPKDIHAVHTDISAARGHFGSPFFFKNFMFSIGFFDILGCLAALVAILLPVTLLLPIVMGALCCILLLVHHLHFLLYVPTIAFIVIVRASAAGRLTLPFLTVASVVAITTAGLFLYLAFDGSVTVPMDAHRCAPRTCRCATMDYPTRGAGLVHRYSLRDCGDHGHAAGPHSPISRLSCYCSHPSAAHHILQADDSRSS